MHIAIIVEELKLKMVRLFFQNNVAKNKTKIIAAGIPETAAICRISLCALSTVFFLQYLKAKKNSFYVLIKCYLRFSGPVPKMGFSPIDFNVIFHI